MSRFGHIDTVTKVAVYHILGILGILRNLLNNLEKFLQKGYNYNINQQKMMNYIGGLTKWVNLL